MKLIILAAGKGSRLENLSKNKPKCLLKIKSTTIIERLIKQFKKSGISNITIISGYQSEKIQEKFLNKYKILKYTKFNETNNLHTLWFAREEIDQDVIISFADLIVENSIVKKIVESKHSFTTLIDSSSIRDGTMFVSHKKNRLLAIGIKNKKKATGNFIGLAKISNRSKKNFIKHMSNILSKSKKDYYTKVFNPLIKKNFKVNTIDVSGKYWREIDTKQDYHKLKKENYNK